jgi:hypothetical protein
MKKLCALVVMVVSVAAVYAGGIVEYKGRKYCAGLYAGAIALEYASKNDLKEYGVDSTISDNKLYFLSPVLPAKTQEIVKREYIQCGDTFLLPREQSQISKTAVYTGSRKNTKGLLAGSGDDMYCYGIGYAVYGGAITIVELMTEDELENNPNIREVK